MLFRCVKNKKKEKNLSILCIFYFKVIKNKNITIERLKLDQMKSIDKRAKVEVRFILIVPSVLLARDSPEKMDSNQIKKVFDQNFFKFYPLGNDSIGLA